jgi:hypothetical protein
LSYRDPVDGVKVHKVVKGIQESLRPAKLIRKLDLDECGGGTTYREATVTYLEAHGEIDSLHGQRQDRQKEMSRMAYVDRLLQSNEVIKSSPLESAMSTGNGSRLGV